MSRRPRSLPNAILPQSFYELRRFRCSGLSPLEPDTGAYSAGSRKNLKHDEEKPHAAGSKTEKKRKKVLTKLQDDEKEPPAAGSKKKKALLPDRIRRFEEILQVKEEPEEEEPRWKSKTVKLKLTEADIKFLEEYNPRPRPSIPAISIPRIPGCS